MVMRNAICLVFGICNDIACDSESEFHLQPSEYRMEELRESSAVLNLADFDRLVFKTCVLVRLSIPSCALLLRDRGKI
jgi:hypothetical protein